MELSEEELELRYQVRLLIPCDSGACRLPIFLLQSFCDPRLNFEQSLGA